MSEMQREERRERLLKACLEDPEGPGVLVVHSSAGVGMSEMQRGEEGDRLLEVCLEDPARQNLRQVR